MKSWEPEGKKNYHGTRILRGQARERLKCLFNDTIFFACHEQQQRYTEASLMHPDWNRVDALQRLSCVCCTRRIAFLPCSITHLFTGKFYSLSLSMLYMHFMTAWFIHRHCWRAESCGLFVKGKQNIFIELAHADIAHGSISHFVERPKAIRNASSRKRSGLIFFFVTWRVYRITIEMWTTIFRSFAGPLKIRGFYQGDNEFKR